MNLPEIGVIFLGNGLFDLADRPMAEWTVAAWMAVSFLNWGLVELVPPINVEAPVSRPSVSGVPILKKYKPMAKWTVAAGTVVSFFKLGTRGTRPSGDWGFRLFRINFL